MSAADFLANHAIDFCKIVEATLPAYQDKASRQAVLSCLCKALLKPAFVKIFATYYVKTLASSTTMLGHSAAVINAASCGCALLSAMVQPEFAKGLPKVMEAISTVVASVSLSVGLRAQVVCIRRVSATLYSSKVLLEAAQATAHAPIISAALLLPHTVPLAAREAAVKAYNATVISSKEKIPEHKLHAWDPCVKQFTATCVGSSLDTLSPMVKRSAETALTNAEALFSVPVADLSPVAEPSLALLLPLLRHSKPAVVQRAADALRHLAACVRGATEYADIACGITDVITGSSGPKPKSGKERAALADAVRCLCPAAWDRRGLYRMHGDFRMAALRVAKVLAACVGSEPVAEAKIAALLAAEAWATAASWRQVYVPSQQGDVEGARQHATELVASLAAVMGGKADADVRAVACTVAGALAVDVDLGGALQAVAGQVADVAVSATAKAAMRGPGCAGLAAAAAAGADSSAASALGATAQKLLDPSALSSVGRHAAYGAVAAWHLLRSNPDMATLPMYSRTLAALALQNDPTARSAANELLPGCIAAAPPIAGMVLSMLWDMLEAYPDIPGIEGPPVPAGEVPSRVGAKLVAHRVVATVTTVGQQISTSDAASIDLLLRVLHHPVVAAADIHAPPQLSTRKSAALLRRLGATDGAVLATVVRRAAGRLRLTEVDENDAAAANGAAADAGTRFTAHSEHLAAQRSAAAVLAVDPGAVWPACFEALKALLCADALAALHVNDIRTFRTPRGRLMVEQFQSQLSPDELFAQHRDPVKASRGSTASVAAKSGAGKKKAPMSKEEQHRQERLEDEVRSCMPPVDRAARMCTSCLRCSTPWSFLVLRICGSGLIVPLLKHAPC